MSQLTPPYAIDKRLAPAGDNPEALLPRQVGPYRRGPLRNGGNYKGDPVYADYESGASAIFMELGVCDSAHDARCILETAMNETVGSVPAPGVLYDGQSDPAYLRTMNADGAFLAWTRGKVYFSAHAKGGEKDLDTFMQAFPY